MKTNVYVKSRFRDCFSPYINLKHSTGSKKIKVDTFHLLIDRYGWDYVNSNYFKRYWNEE